MRARSDEAASPRRNRVTPWGEVVAVPARGTTMGNRGILVDKEGRPKRARWTTWSWIACRLDFRGASRPVAPPGRWTALFFSDDAAALAAGHRPCGFCRRHDFVRFKSAWATVHGPMVAREMDVRLHAERTRERTVVDPRAMPDDTFVGGPEACWRIVRGEGRRWSWDGYGRPEKLATALPLLTPPSVVAMLAEGYRPGLDAGT